MFEYKKMTTTEAVAYIEELERAVQFLSFWKTESDIMAMAIGSEREQTAKQVIETIYKVFARFTEPIGNAGHRRKDPDPILISDRFDL